jgi:hypothetical protein
VTTDPPPPGSPWARRCPDAYPAEWFAALGLAALPPGFARFATPDEFAVITGATPPAEPAPRRPSPSPSPGPKPAPGGGRFAVLNEFVDVSMRGLTGAAVAVWLVLYRDTKPTGTVRTGQTDIARRAGLTPRGVRKGLAKLVAAGLVEVVRRGGLGAGPSVYRVRGARPA